MVTRNHALALVAGSIALLVASLFLARANQSVFGLSSDFWAGFLLGLGLVMMSVAIVALVSPSKSD